MTTYDPRARYNAARLIRRRRHAIRRYYNALMAERWGSAA